jgi:hypothetical protein
MKYALALLLLGSPSILFAQPIHRCVDHQGQLSFQSNPCPNIEARLASYEPSGRSMAWRNSDQGRIDAHAERQRVQALLAAGDIEKNALDENNQARCLGALRAAKMCGRFAGMFSCGKHGFQHEEPSAKNSVDLLRAVKSGGGATMQQCVQQVSE